MDPDVPTVLEDEEELPDPLPEEWPEDLPPPFEYEWGGIEDVEIPPDEGYPDVPPVGDGVVPDDPAIPSDFTYCPDHDACFLAFMQLLPTGTAWDNTEITLEKGSVIRQFMSALALSWLNFEDAMCVSLDEWICRTSDEDYDMWERDFGVPDECDIYNMNLCAKVEHAAGNVPTAKYLLDLMASHGYAATGRWLTGDDDAFPGVRSTFHMVIDATISPAFAQGAILNFPLGADVRLGYATLDEVDCMLERYIPAHCVVDISVSGAFTPTTLGPKLKAWFTADNTVDGAVASWADPVSTATATSPAGKQPISAIGFAGKRWLTFDGVDDYMRTAAISVHPAGNAASEVTALVLNDAIDAPLRYVTVSGTNQRAMAMSGAPSYMVLSDAALTYTDAGNVLGIGIMGAAYGPGIYGAVNGYDTTPAGTPGTLATTIPAALTIGASGAGTPASFLKGRIRHLIITQGMDYYDSSRLEGWLAWDIGRTDLLPSDHPYKNIRP